MTDLVVNERENPVQGEAFFTLHSKTCSVLKRAKYVSALTETLVYQRVCQRCKPDVTEAERIIAEGIAEYEAQRKATARLSKQAESERLRRVKGLAPQLRIDWPGAMLSSHASGKYRAQLADNFAVEFDVIDTRTSITRIGHSSLVLTSTEDFRRAYRPLQLIEQFVAIDD